MGDYENLSVWQKSHTLTCLIYRATDELPARHRFVLGEANELHYLLLVARDVDAMSAEVANRLRVLADEVRRMLSSLIATVRQRGRPK